MRAPGDITLYVDPFSHHFLEDRLFDPSVDRFGGDDILGPWVYLRDWFTQRGVAVTTADRLEENGRRTDVSVYISLGMQERCRRLAARGDVVMSAYFACEGPIVEPSLYSNLSWVKDCVKRVYSFSDAESLAPFLSEPLDLLPFCLPCPVEGVHEKTWRQRDRRFLVMINGNKVPRSYHGELYTERLRAVEYFGRTDEIDLFGIGWDVPPFRMGKTRVPYAVQRVQRSFLALKQGLRPDPLLEAARKRWLGAVESKNDTLGKYTYAICFENQLLRGWITEKIFDCFRAGTIPVYWGATDIEDHIPPECFVDMHSFSGYPELGAYLHELGPAKIDGFREAARAYLESEAFYPFSKQAFVDRCRTIITQDTGISVE